MFSFPSPSFSSILRFHSYIYSSILIIYTQVSSISYSSILIIYTQVSFIYILIHPYHLYSGFIHIIHIHPYHLYSGFIHILLIHPFHLYSGFFHIILIHPYILRFHPYISYCKLSFSTLLG